MFPKSFLGLNFSGETAASNVDEILGILRKMERSGASDYQTLVFYLTSGGGMFIYGYSGLISQSSTYLELETGTNRPCLLMDP